MKVTRLITVLMFCSLLGCGNASNDQQQTPNTIQQQVSLNALKQGDMSSITYSSPHVDVIRNETDWANYWNQLFSTYSPKPERPSINFQNATVIALVDGQHSSGGYSITINRIDITSSAAIVYATQGTPGQGCIVTQSFTQPFSIVTIPTTFSGTATLELSQNIYNCTQ